MHYVYCLLAQIKSRCSKQGPTTALTFAVEIMAPDVKDAPASQSLSTPNSDQRHASRFKPGEEFWLGHRDWLKDQGYLLRPRYQAEWNPSWRDTDADEHEDGQYYMLMWAPLQHGNVMDATMSLDGSFVMMKQVESPGVELDIAVWFQKSHSDLTQQTIASLSAASSPIQMSLAGQSLYDKPRFDTIGEAVGFFTQIFEGLQFIHKNNVAHR
ncbi:hypothetical protein B0H10DRAFT_1968639, partial [Mycena sp. CBHHK59/15]